MKKVICVVSVILFVLSTAFIKDDIVDLKKVTKRNIEEYFARLDAIKNNPQNKLTLLMSICKDLLWGKDMDSQADRRVIDYTNPSINVPIKADLAILNFADFAEKGRINDFTHQISGDISVLKEPGANNERVMCAKYLVTFNGKKRENYFKVVNGRITRVDCFSEPVAEQPSHPSQPSHQPSQTSTSIENRYDAAYYYSKGNYNKAYQLYLKIINTNRDGDVYYRLAVMTYYGEGCKHLFSKNKYRYDKVEEYLKAAIKYGDSEIRKNAENMWENVN